MPVALALWCVAVLLAAAVLGVAVAPVVRAAAG